MFSVADNELDRISGAGSNCNSEDNSKIVSAEWIERCPSCKDDIQCVLYDIYGPDMRYCNYEIDLSCNKCGYYERIDRCVV